MKTAQAVYTYLRIVLAVTVAKEMGFQHHPEVYCSIADVCKRATTFKLCRAPTKKLSDLLKLDSTMLANVIIPSNLERMDGMIILLDIVRKKEKVLPDRWGFRETNWTPKPGDIQKQRALIIDAMDKLFFILMKWAVISNKSTFTRFVAGLFVGK